MKTKGLKKDSSLYCHILATRYRYGQEPYPHNLQTGPRLQFMTKGMHWPRFKQSNLVDCRINGYPTYTEFHGIMRQTPDFIFIDLDLENFLPFANWSSKQLLDMALGNTLWKIKQGFGKDIEPTVVWTGNGYHIYLPLQPLPIPLESDPMFSTFQYPSKEFLKFAALYLTDGKSDPNNKPTFASSLVRIPGSFNAKCLEAWQGSGRIQSQYCPKMEWDCTKNAIGNAD